jgi:hypothetical protein
MKEFLNGLGNFLVTLIGLIIALAIVVLILGVLFTIVFYFGYGIGWVVEFLTNIKTISNIPTKELFGYLFVLISGISIVCNRT